MFALSLSFSDLFALARSAKYRHGGLASWGGHGAVPQTQARRTAENRAHFGRGRPPGQGRGGLAPRGRQGAPDEAVRTVVATVGATGAEFFTDQDLALP